MINNPTYLQEKFDRLQEADAGSGLAEIRQKAFNSFHQLGLPTVRNEEWKYTRVGSVLDKGFSLGSVALNGDALRSADIDALRLPGYATANELVFVNGYYNQSLSVIRSEGLVIESLQAASVNQYSGIVKEHFNHSSRFLPDGVNALNTAFIDGGIFVHIDRNKVIAHPIYIYNITDARAAAVLSQPRSLVYVSEHSEVSIVETYATLGVSESFTNQVMEIVVEKDAHVSYCKIQRDSSQASQVSTTHVRQVGKSVVQTVTISLGGNLVRNNLHTILEAPFAESHLYGLYFQKGQSHIDNHTLVDHAVPNCESNELYKGILDGSSTGVFNGKVMVRKDAQKTNAFQSNKNILLSDTASVNTKPQLEIYADDVKCSHGCTIGSIDAEALFYLQSRGVPQQAAMALLLQGFAMDVLNKISLAPIRSYVEDLIVERLNSEA